jgi:hypothetical protein
MYQLATNSADVSPARRFLEAASVTNPTPSNLAFVDAFTESLRSALRGDDFEPLLRAVRRAEMSGADVHDLLAAAEYEINESMLDFGLTTVHDTAVRLGAIIRDVRRQPDAMTLLTSSYQAVSA